MVTIHSRPFAPPTQRAGLAIAAMILGIFAVVFVGLSLVSLAWMPTAALMMIPALICGFIALGRANRNPVAYSGRGFAITGIFTAFASLPLALVALAIIYSASISNLLHSLSPGGVGSRNSPSTQQIDIHMHDASDLTELPYFDSVMQCRIRLPKANDVIDFPPPPNTEIERSFVVPGADHSIIVAILPRGTATFRDYVQSARIKLLDSTDGKFVMDDEGWSTIHGHDVYVITASVKDGGIDMKSRMVIVDGPQAHVYALYGNTSAASWSEFDDLFDSVFSTFEIGDFKGEPALAAQPAQGGSSQFVLVAPGGMPGMPAGTPSLSPGPSAAPQPPVTPAERTGVAAAAPASPPQPLPQAAARQQIGSLDGALALLNDPDREQRKAAFQYIENSPVTDAKHDEVVIALSKSLGDPAFRGPAFAAYKPWATKNDVPSLRQFLSDLVKADHGLDGGKEREGTMQLLARFGDVESAPLMAASLHNYFMRSEASKALVALGSGAQSAVWPVLSDSDSGVAEEGLRILSKIGTEQSMAAVEKAKDGKDAAFVQRANETTAAIAKRLNLAPPARPH